ncbi:hypothetical protein GMLC_10400 [Geomonas limicola]|uniref:Tetratricopeptide repeat protein n=1 Tax=Geomonas limicola TaxID=2740186 RepID=A0A6V8N4U4_9BACT|nr:hypothetical protein [Geomonas limicola]GFO67461.1 hypothetical protein GMLC_10400 [Geomonas limicola]
MEKIKSIAVNAAFIALVSIVLIWGNTLYRQHVQFSKGERAMAAGDFVGALAGWESAIHMYTPFSPTVDQSAQRLWDLGESCVRRGDTTRALLAYRSLRSSFYALSGFYQPGEEWIKKCDARIAQLVKQGQPTGAR